VVRLLHPRVHRRRRPVRACPAPLGRGRRRHGVRESGRQGLDPGGRGAVVDQRHRPAWSLSASTVPILAATTSDSAFLLTAISRSLRTQETVVLGTVFVLLRNWLCVISGWKGPAVLYAGVRETGGETEVGDGGKQRARRRFWTPNGRCPLCFQGTRAMARCMHLAKTQYAAPCGAVFFLKCENINTSTN
jgi:hypothetical protein